MAIAALVSIVLPTTAIANAYGRLNVAQLLAGTPAIVKTQVPGSSDKQYYKIKGTDIVGFVDPNSIDDAFLRNDQEVLVVPLDSGGSGGVFTTLLWTRSAGGSWRFVGYVPSKDGHLNVHVEQGQLVAVTPVYGPNDANCCPSKHRYVRYSLDGIKLQKVQEYTVP